MSPLRWHRCALEYLFLPLLAWCWATTYTFEPSKFLHVRISLSQFPPFSSISLFPFSQPNCYSSQKSKVKPFFQFSSYPSCPLLFFFPKTLKEYSTFRVFCSPPPLSHCSLSPMALIHWKSSCQGANNLVAKFTGQFWRIISLLRPIRGLFPSGSSNLFLCLSSYKNWASWNSVVYLPIFWVICWVMSSPPGTLLTYPGWFPNLLFWLRPHSGAPGSFFQPRLWTSLSIFYRHFIPLLSPHYPPSGATPMSTNSPLFFFLFSHLNQCQCHPPSFLTQKFESSWIPQLPSLSPITFSIHVTSQTTEDTFSLKQDT